MKLRGVKKVACAFLTAAVLMSGLTGCSSKEKEVVVLGNQQNDINNILEINEIENIDKFRGERWLDNGNILGIENMEYSENNKEISNIVIYDINTGELKTISNNKDRGKVWLTIEDVTKDERYVLYKKFTNREDENEKIDDVYIIDLESGQERKIEDSVNAVSDFEDGNKVILAKGMDIYGYDVHGNKNKIELPEEMIKKMKDFSRLSFDDYLKQYEDGENISDKDIKQIKKEYDYQKNNNCISKISKKGDEIYIQTYNRIPLAYNIKTSDYRELAENDVRKFWSYEKKVQNIVTLEENDSGFGELWELDSNGNRKKMIEKGNFRGNIKVSPDNTKVVYCLYGESGEKTMFIYDLGTEKSIKIFPKVIAGVVWDKSSSKFLMRKPIKMKDGKIQYTTSIVIMD